MNEFFFLQSYSCIPEVIERLDILRESTETKAYLYCFTSALYQFLQPLEDLRSVEVRYFDFLERSEARAQKNPISIYRYRLNYKQNVDYVLENIPVGSIIHFYNCHSALFVFSLVWRLRNKCQIHYTEVDPVDLYTPDWSISNFLRRVLLFFLIPTPIFFNVEILHQSNPRGILVVPNRWIQKVTDVKHNKITDLSRIMDLGIYQKLTYISNRKVLWIMGKVLDKGEVHQELYLRTLRECQTILADIYGPRSQAIKFHPQAGIKEEITADEMEIIPVYIPSEFIKFSELELMVTTSSGAIKMIPDDVPILSLVELLPFINEGLRAKHNKIFMNYADTKTFLIPKELKDLYRLVHELYDQ